jgi:branched-chain amino acid transport system substrate-binding protein
MLRKRAVVLIVAALVGTAITAGLSMASASKAPVTNYLKYVGGKAGKADPKLSPVYIGWINQQGGSADIGPGATAGADAAVAAINTLYGGIGGHPLKLKKCFVTNAEEQGTKCAQQMVNDKKVQVIANGAVAIGSQSEYSTIAGKKPLVLNVGLTPADPTLKNGFVLFGDQLSILAPFGTFARDVLHAKTAAVVYPQIAGLSTAAAATAQGLKDAGLTVKTVGYDPNATDLTGPLTAAGVQNVDVVEPALDVPGCILVAKGLQQLGAKAAVVSNPLCLNAEVVKALGDLAPWYYGIASANAVDPTDPAVPPMLALYKKFGLIKQAADPWLGIAVGEIMTIGKWMNAAGGPNATAAGIIKQAKAFRGPLLFGAPDIYCGKNPKRPANCSDETQFYQYHGAGKFTRASSWLRPPKTP